MDRSQVTVAAQLSRSDLVAQEEERKLSAEEYITHTKKVAVERVMGEFQKWLDKRLAIISYTIEASEASDDSGTGPDNSGSQGQGRDGRFGGANSRPKRHFNEDGSQDDLSGEGDEKEDDRGGNKRVKKEGTDPDQIRFACPFRKHNPAVHTKAVCVKGGWKSIHRLKEHLYRVHRLPNHQCQRCGSCFEEHIELEGHVYADERCEKRNVVSEEGIDQHTERRLRVRKKHNSGQTEAQQWSDLYVLLFPGVDQAAVPSPYPDYNDSTSQSTKLQNYQHVEKRIKKVLPRLVRQRVERKFETVEADVLHGLNDIVRNCLADFFRNNMSSDGGSSTTTPQTASRANTPALTSTDENHALSLGTDIEIDLGFDELLNDPTLDFGGGFGPFDFFPDAISNGGNGYGMDNLTSDSGYVSTNTYTSCL
ncbi:hypothetical protein F4808DRAFT_154405 [Astrocystis sublimbata]|nr:hypothetical protein F4808DRAFT_154405 [Astrocystis sublimbata]